MKNNNCPVLIEETDFFFKEAYKGTVVIEQSTSSLLRERTVIHIMGFR